MLVLAIDTSGRHGSVALCRGNANRSETLKIERLEGGTYSARLVPTIQAVLREGHLQAEQLDGLAIVSGPGSFTGLRVGLATVKGLCETLQKPLATVSMLEAVALRRATSSGRIAAVLDAGRGEVYVGEYDVDEHAARAVREYLVKVGEFEAAAFQAMTPDSGVSDALQAKGANIRLVEPVQADEIGHIALRKLLRGEVADHATVDVNYIRRSDAEIFSAPKR